MYSGQGSNYPKELVKIITEKLPIIYQNSWNIIKMLQDWKWAIMLHFLKPYVYVERSK